MTDNCPNCAMGSYRTTPDMESTERVCSYCGCVYFTDIDYKSDRNAEIRGRVFNLNIVAERIKATK